MGGSSWSDDTYRSRSAPRASAPVHTTFAQTTTHKLLDPKGVKVRESRDSEAHPNSNGILVFFDVTGSMGHIPALFANEKLGGLMRMLLAQNVIADPQLLFGAIGDAFSDSSPFQVAQFESGLEMDDWLTKIHLEGNGGGSGEESYELAFYWAATHTSMDCWEKRGKKGYLFVIGDEQFYPTVRSEQVDRIIGDRIQDMPIAAAIAAAQETFEVFKICVHSPTYATGNIDAWRTLMGERAVFLQDPNTVCEFIAAQIASCEGIDRSTISSTLAASGLSSKNIDNVTKSLVVGAGGGTALKKGSVSGDLAPIAPGRGGTERL